MKKDIDEERLSVTLFIDNVKGTETDECMVATACLSQRLSIIVAKINSVINRFNVPIGDHSFKDLGEVGEKIKTELIVSQSDLQSIIRVLSLFSCESPLPNDFLERQALFVFSHFIDAVSKGVNNVIFILQDCVLEKNEKSLGKRKSLLISN